MEIEIFMPVKRTQPIINKHVTVIELSIYCAREINTVRLKVGLSGAQGLFQLNIKERGAY